jgi:hypothetical protein
MESLERIINELKAHVRQNILSIFGLAEFRTLDQTAEAEPFLKPVSKKIAPDYDQGALQSAVILRRYALIMLYHSHHETDGLDDVVEERQEQNVQDEEELCTGFEPHLEQLFDV